MPNTKLGPRFTCCCTLAGLLASTGSADAPQGHFTVVAETVEDAATKLTWQRAVPDKTFHYAEAVSYCAALSLRGTGWRLPTIKELHTLVDEARMHPAIDTHAFPETPSAYFWSATRVASFGMYAWTVSFEDGTDLWYPAENQHHVRCVR